ncbi:MAG: hypothetical protein Q8L54_10270 [Devosia sp.]|nr:hypothetical protein [Devosia sp.]
MIRGAAIAVALAGLSTPSMATEWINGGDAEGQASFDFLAGALDVISVVGPAISVGAMDEKPGARMAELRLFKAREGDADTIYAGTLRVPGHGAWAVNCSGT